MARGFAFRTFSVWFSLISMGFVRGDSFKLPPGYVIAKNTISPSHRYAFTAPQEDVFVFGDPSREHNQLIDQNSGKVVATVLGEPGCVVEWKGGILDPWWSKDESIVAWNTVNRSFQGAFVILKLKDDKLLWQTDIMKVCSAEIWERVKAFQETRKEAVAFKVADINVAVDTDPNYFSGQTTAPLTLPLKLRIKSFPSPDWPFEATLEATIQEDGTVKFGNFHVLQE